MRHSFAKLRERSPLWAPGAFVYRRHDGKLGMVVMALREEHGISFSVLIDNVLCVPNGLSSQYLLVQGW